MTDTHPEIRRYLAAVDRAASALPTDRRDELLDDLSEHIEVALAERPGALAEILAELGSPEEIAATAIREDDTLSEALRGRGNPRLVVTLLALSSVLGPLAWLPGCGSLGHVAEILVVAGLVALWRSAWWTAEQKWLTFAALAVPNLVLAGVTEAMGGGAVLTAVRLVVVTAVRAAVLVRLWRRRTVPNGPGRVPIPRWAGILAWSVLGVCVLIVAAGIGEYLSLSGDIQSVSVNP